MGRRARQAVAVLIAVMVLGTVAPLDADARQNRGLGYHEALRVKAAAERHAERQTKRERERRRDARAVRRWSRVYGRAVGRWAGIVNDYFAGHVGEALYVIRGESGGDPRACNGASGSRGLLQLHPCHAAAFRRVTGKPYYWGVFQPRSNIRFAAYMSRGGRDWSAWSVRP